MNDVVLECRDLAKTYGSGKMRVPVLRGVDLQIRRGEQLAIVGASGAGKSTLLHLLAGLDAPSAGAVYVNGENFSELSESERGVVRNHTLGFVYQFHHLLPEFTALENVMLPLLARRAKTRLARSDAMDLLEKVGLSHRVNHKPGELSGGERQRVAIARALVIRPACLLADEPTGNIDRQNAETVQQLMLSLDKDLQVSLIVATHDGQLAATMERSLTLRDGRLEPSRQQ